MAEWRFVKRVRMVLKMLKEGVVFAYNELKGNKFRTFLSLLGVSIGIFCIVAVFTAIDALQKNVRKGFESLGSNAVQISKWPGMGAEDDEGNSVMNTTGEFKWWEYMRRPPITYEDYKFLRDNSQKADAIVLNAGFTALLKNGRNSIDNAHVICPTGNFRKVVNVDLQSGRFFTEAEAEEGKTVAIIGYEVAQELYKDENPIGKSIKINGNSAIIIGVFEKQGNGILNVMATDKAVFIPFKFGKVMVDFDDSDALDIIAIPKQGVDADEFTGELKMLMRQHRRLRPSDKYNFSTMKMTSLLDMVKTIFKAINRVGWIIAMFSLLIGGFGIANIMFVSVKERTNIIGIQKALGAKKYIILTQFLTEAVLLAIAGAIVGILLVAIILLVAPIPPEYEVTLTMGNVLAGVLIASIIGIISGLLPASAAANLNPVDAINSK
ncbi:MAG: ABC transporter permease [Bacteroidales bacterium]|jgi:putative ABC transport system permease protein|nr:ABC transporter permease [Bacteroidales bacterium]MCI1732873.1 ABC transporter permease [Bacteroidales bacterium]